MGEKKKERAALGNEEEEGKKANEKAEDEDVGRT
jgi:hypothetical protein